MLLALLEGEGHHDPAEGEAVDAPDDGVRGRGDRCRAGLAVEQRQLAKAATGADLGDLLVADVDLKAARVDDVKVVTLVALLDDVVARAHGHFPHRVHNLCKGLRAAQRKVASGVGVSEKRGGALGGQVSGAPFDACSWNPLPSRQSHSLSYPAPSLPRSLAPSRVLSLPRSLAPSLNRPVLSDTQRTGHLVLVQRAEEEQLGNQLRQADLHLGRLGVHDLGGRRKVLRL